MNDIRYIVKIKKCNTVIYMIGFIIFGSFMGVGSKFLDNVESHKLLYILQVMDINNFFSRFAIWIFIAVLISIYSKSPYRASIYVFCFFLSMVSSYYLYTNFVLGFFPQSYAMIWFVFTIVSPVLAYICWFAKGKGKLSMAISSCIVAILFNLAFSYGMFYIDVNNISELLLFIIMLFVLKRSYKEMILVVGVGIILGMISNVVSPISFW